MDTGTFYPDLIGDIPKAEAIIATCLNQRLRLIYYLIFYGGRSCHRDCRINLLSTSR